MDKRKLALDLGRYAYITFGLFGFFYYFTIGSLPLLINNLTTSVFCFISVQYLKKEKLNVETYSHILILTTYTSLAILNIFLGGINSPMLYWFLAIVLGAGFMLDTKWMLIWGANLSLYYIGCFILKVNDVSLPYQANLSGYLYELYHLSSLIGVISLLLVFARSYILITQQYNHEIKESDERNSFLLKILNHDLANPVTVLDLYTKRLTPENCLDLKVKLQKSLQNIIESLNSVRSIDKFHISEMKLDKVPLKECIMELLPEIQEMFSDKNLNFTVDIPDQIEVSIAKGIFTNQIIKNLLTNACKFSIPGATVSILYKENSLLIKDQGIGIPETMIPTLFQYKTNNSRKGTLGEKGTGFGLPIVKDCCDKMKIKISVDSDEDGTAFSLDFAA